MSEDTISEATRRVVLLRDNYRCRRCGDEDLVGLTLHHVVYRSHGGGHKSDNLVTVCWPCHSLIHAKKVILARLRGHWFFGDVLPRTGTR